MVRTVDVPQDQIEVRGNQIEVHADVGAGRVIGLKILIEDAGASDASGTDPSEMSFEEWERNLDAMIALAPVNEFPCDDSREAIYGPDPDEDDQA